MLMIMTSVSGTRSLPSIAVERVMTMSAMSDISLFLDVPEKEECLLDEMIQFFAISNLERIFLKNKVTHQPISLSTPKHAKLAAHESVYPNTAGRQRAPPIKCCK